ncbi:TPA: hypothetical protein VO148_000986 [Streptococcus pyogenes]|nr:hypothetical protein [Streptococcus pyogenes]
MEIGETVEFIRHSKNISIKQVCGDYLTRQTYYRFIKNNLDISSKKLLYILDNLNVNVDEFLFISNNFKQYKEFIDMDTAKHYFECRNIEGLNHILDSYKDSKSTKEKNLFALVKVLLATLTKEGAEQKCVQILEIFQLLNCKTIHHMFQTYLEAIKHKLS